MRHSPPQIQWRPVLIGGAAAFLVSLAVGLAATAFGSEGLVLAATPLGLAAGGATAGRLAGSFGLLQGGMVGVLWIVAEALASTFDPQAADVLEDVALTLAGDVVRIAIAGAAGWLGARSS